MAKLIIKTVSVAKILTTGACNLKFTNTTLLKMTSYLPAISKNMYIQIVTSVQTL